MGTCQVITALVIKDKGTMDYKRTSSDCLNIFLYIFKKRNYIFTLF